MGRSRVWTEPVLRPVVAESSSVREVILKLGLKEAGGNHANIKRRIQEYGLDTSHFVGQAHQRGKHSNNRQSADEVLVKGHKIVDVARIRRALDEIGRPRLCVGCKNGEIWNGLPLRLQVDHVDGDRYNNLPSNLRYLCPNCHSQTDTFGVRNAKKPDWPIAIEPRCPGCNRIISRNSKTCRSCRFSTPA